MCFMIYSNVLMIRDRNEIIFRIAFSALPGTVTLTIFVFDDDGRYYISSGFEKLDRSSDRERGVRASYYLGYRQTRWRHVYLAGSLAGASFFTARGVRTRITSY